MLLLPKPLDVYGSMLLLSTLILSSYSIIVVMLECDWGLRMVINITCLKIPGSGFISAAFEYPSMINKEIIQYIVYYLPKPRRSTPVAQSAPRNLLTRWDVSSIPANGIFLTKN